MRIIAKLAVLPFALVAFGCARDEPAASTELSADLRKDLELASSAGLDLASSQSTRQQLVVSGIEAGPRAAPVRRAPKPRASNKPKAAKAPEIESAPEVEMALEPVPAPEAVQVAASTEPPVAAPRPTAPPIIVPTSGGVFDGGIYGDRDRRGRGGIVIIRGGHAGVDRCERRPRAGRGGLIGEVVAAGVGIAINNRAPSIGIRGAPTFPR